MANSKGAATIIYVHGIGNKPPASILKAQWDRALFQFDLGERSRMAYWVDRERYPEPLLAAAAGGDFADESEEEMPREFSPKAVRAQWHAAAELADAQNTIENIVDPEQASARDVERLQGIATAMLEENLLTDDARYEEVAAALRTERGNEVRRLQAQRVSASGVRAKVLGFLPRPLRQLITRRITRMFLRDVNDLFVDAVKSERMRASLRERLRAGGGPFVVIAHSQGSMIAYSVLCEPEFANLDVPLFVTIGSPLGIQEVQDFIRQLTKQQRLSVPRNVRRWINVADWLDPVALDKWLKQDFAANAAGVTVEDVQKFNADSPRHPHSATGYLELEAVRLPVRETVDTGLFQPVARFKIAKDVVRDLADAAAEERHRVLLQLNDFNTTEMTRRSALDRIYAELNSLYPDAANLTELLGAEELQHYVALNLTRHEIERLGASAHEQAAFPVARVWKNNAKRALLDCSVHTTQAFPAHNSYQASGKGIVWAVLDSGINPGHPHFQQFNTIRRMYDCTRKRNAPNGALRLLSTGVAADLKDMKDNYGHGDHVAGIIAGRYEVPDKDNQQRVMCGMAPAATLDIYKVLDDSGMGDDAWIIKAIDHIFETNEQAGELVIHGVNLSLGGPVDVEAFNCGHTPLCMELRRLWRQGVVVVIAAGNEGYATLASYEGEEVPANMPMTVGDPGNLEEAIVVGSVHKEKPHTYGLSYFSSRGPTADGRMKPDCVAPGERIFSVRNDAPGQVTPNTRLDDLYTELSGTSMAAPHVSGLIAAFLSRRREFIGEPDRVKQILLDNCTDLQRQRHMQGAGMPNLVKMLVNV